MQGSSIDVRHFNTTEKHLIYFRDKDSQDKQTYLLNMIRHFHQDYLQTHLNSTHFNTLWPVQHRICEHIHRLGSKLNTQSNSSNTTNNALYNVSTLLKVWLDTLHKSSINNRSTKKTNNQFSYKSYSFHNIQEYYKPEPLRARDSKPLDVRYKMDPLKGR